MNFDKFFKFISYAVVFCGFLSLSVSSGIGALSSAVFISILVLAWFLENSRWQISERIGTVLIFAIVPLFYVDWKYQIIGLGTSETVVAGALQISPQE